MLALFLVHYVSLQVNSGSDIKENRASRSDQLVTRMRNFFQA